MDNIVKIRAWDGDSDSLRQAAEVYAAVFSERPYQGEPDEEVESFIERAWRYQDQLPDFRLLVAAADSDVVGLALGSGTMAGDWWYDAVSQQLSHEQRERWMPGQCFSVGELAVREDQRRRGIGERLMRGVVAQLDYRTALLTVDARAIPAQRLYFSLAWEQIADHLTFGLGVQKWLMGLRLNA